ncbi:crustacyanin-A2 subunit-like [Homarus americanus]|uniref:Crustacyanin-A2 subunit-like 7 n=1 Tax=Homarus americanus TaxID=6706 RepID=A0A8J5JJU0_HOMAM|nr:crustacyanin-A2 subunit-like [Homarus americanus]KAG7159857.1 Crustacyanin-A2 subunit-like 7 [Homarus americanus]
MGVAAAVVVLVVAVLGVATVSLAETSTLLEVGACPNVTTQPNLDQQKLEGQWYHIIRFPTNEEPFVTCTRSAYTYTDGYLEVKTEGRNASDVGVTRSGVLGQMPDSPSGALQLDMDGMPPLRVWVVYTDYTSVACLYSCSQFPGLRAEWAWVMSRTVRPNVKVVMRCRTKLRQLKVNAAKFKRVPQRSNCYTN